MTRSTAILAKDPDEKIIPVHLVDPESLDRIVSGLDAPQRSFVAAQGFKAEAGKIAVLPDAEGNLARVLFGLGSRTAGEFTPLVAGRLSALPAGTYRLSDTSGDEAELAALAFALGSYRFEHYRKAKEARPTLVAPAGTDAARLQRIADAVFLARDLINIPADALGPRDLADAVKEVADRFEARSEIVDGERLASEFPMVHAVGVSSDRPPCLVDFRWGAESHPKVTLVGKGVAFDTGGLDIKPASAMLTMKKDMGGAANVLALAQMIMSAGLKVRLRVLVPAVENAISGRAFRPGDVLASRKGLSVEIGNTDAEGRLILADALAYADEEEPELLLTMSTLTGAARVAVGPEIVPFYATDDDFAEKLQASGRAVWDPLWRMPFWQPYDAWLSSKVADLSHISSNAFAGSIVAALFLKRFVEKAKSFAHFDIFAWNATARPAGPEGGEAQAIRALFHYLSARYG